MKIAGVEFDLERPVGIQTPVEKRPLLFQPLTIRGVTMRNRIMLAPMSQYLAADGVPTDWQLVHLGQFAMGGAGIVFSEETDVEERGRRTHKCTGMYNTEQARAWRRITDFLKDLGAVPAMQLGHSGSKGSIQPKYQGRKALADGSERDGKAWSTISSCALPFNGRPAPTALDNDGIRDVIQSWRNAALLANDAGFDIIEIHGAHGYLLGQFLSPLLNKRTDAYGGDLQGRMRFVLELTEAVRDAWPKEKPLFYRASAVDGPGGYWDIDDTVALAKELKARGVDVIDCSSGTGGMTGPTQLPPVPRGMPGFHAMYAEEVRREVGIATVAVGLITEPHQAETILQDERADIIGIAREMMRDPYWPIHAAEALGLPDWMDLLPPTYVERLKLREEERQQWDEDPTQPVPFRLPE